MLHNTFFARPNAEELSLEETTDSSDHSDTTATALELPVDLIQTQGQLVLRAPISGGGIEDIDITLNPDQITITKRPYTSPQDKEIHEYYQECFWGHLTRTIDLPEPVDPDTTKATLADGVLTIIMPLYKNSKTKVIRINP